MSMKLLRVARWMAGLLLAAALIVAGFAWNWRGHEPGLRIAGQSLVPLAFSPDGKVLAVCESGGGFGLQGAGAVRFLGTSTGAEVAPSLFTGDDPKGHYPLVRADYSPDGKYFAVLQENGFQTMQLVVFDLESRKRVTAQPIYYHPYGGKGHVLVRFAPDSSFVAWSGHLYGIERSVVVWDLATEKERFALGKTRFLAVSPDSQLLATIDDPPRDNYNKHEKISLKLWNTRSGELARAIELAGDATVDVYPAFSPDGKWVAVSSSASGGTRTEVFKTDNGERVFDQQTWGPQFAADGRSLVTVWGRDVQLWDTASWQMRKAYPFDLGRHWDNGDQINPRPLALGGQPLVVVFNYYPSFTSPRLSALGRSVHLYKFGGTEFTVIDAAHDTRQAIQLHGGLLMASSIWSDKGDRAAFGFLDGNVVIADLPPKPSNLAPGVATVLVVVLLILWIGLLRLRSAKPVLAATP